jgi:hypothetical protein
MSLNEWQLWVSAFGSRTGQDRRKDCFPRGKRGQPKGRSDDTIRNEGLDFAELFLCAPQPEGLDLCQ